MPDKKIIIFTPHPDDETLGCGGTIVKKVKEGYEVNIVVMTDGRYAFSTLLNININPTPDKLKEMRKKELIKAMNILGVLEKNIIFLDYIDGTLNKNESEVEEIIINILNKNRPDEIYFTYEKDFNLDHRAANKIIKKAIEKSGLSITKYKYSITQIYDNFGPLVDSFFNLFKNNLIYVDISDILPLKREAFEEYKSQISIISNLQKEPLLTTRIIKKHLKKYEIYYKDK